MPTRDQPNFNSDRNIIDQFLIPEPFADIIVEINELSKSFSMLQYLHSTEASFLVLSQLSSVLQRLFQMNPVLDLENDLSFHLTESCRYAAALHVLFPLMAYFPDPTLLVGALVHRLKFSLASLLPLMGPSNQFLLWLLAVGAISAEQMPERQWFEGHLALIASGLSIIV
ncbi:hypothetical protein AOQ84DRAFT_376076 [Glonium stellatum]|uniref:Uncharacterized protein n=1 Tax=Glonium stellatum TaxID=574774 RepID=A0A8E2JU33_9PEZI|nr:hypothetical protein AOQ84DRAFT_376076 [Glonium stellatum]